MSEIYSLGEYLIEGYESPASIYIVQSQAVMRAPDVMGCLPWTAGTWLRYARIPLSCVVCLPASVFFLQLQWQGNKQQWRVPCKKWQVNTSFS